MFTKTLGFHYFWVQGPWGPGPWSKAPGAHGICFCDFLKSCFMVWDLSRSVPKVFRSPGNTLIKLYKVTFILKSGNITRLMSDPPRKLSVYTLRSIWSYGFLSKMLKHVLKNIKYGSHGPQGPWTMGPMGPRDLGPKF